MSESDPLSPDAQAVLDAVVDGAQWPFHVIARPMATATIRAAVDRVLPHENAPLLMRGNELERLCQRQHSRSLFLAIAAELEGDNTTTTQEKP
jgi:hypothetical protein